MHSTVFLLASLGALTQLASAKPVAFPGTILKRSNATSYYEKRQQPPGLANPHSNIYGPDFVAMGDKGWGPALAAMPMFNFARIDGNQGTCYPEGAKNAAGDGPNPGTNVPPSFDPGEDCTDPGPYNGDLSPGDPFPVYTDGVYCQGDNTWRINYNLYFVHDGSTSAGHVHDWEHVTLVFQKDESGQDWWYRAYVIYSQHTGTHPVGYADVISINNDGDLGDLTKGYQRDHPKVFVGMYKHAMFEDKDDSCRSRACADGDEYRSTDWWRIPELADIHNGVAEIPADWDYGDATSDPAYVVGEACGYALS